MDQSVTPLAFVGKLPASKSVLNRLLVVQSHFPKFQIDGDNDCDDVRAMRACVRALNEGGDLEVGAAGTVLRFMALRASRIPGRHRLTGHPRLFARPQDELLKILRQVGVSAELSSDNLLIEGDGWKLQGDTLHVPCDRSSQFATAVLINSWSLPTELFISLSGRRVSEGYWRMSVRMCERLGMKIDFWDHDLRILKNQRVDATSMAAESDVSSAFALAGVAAVNGQATFLDFPSSSLQPDSVFANILQDMGVPIEHRGSTLKVNRAARLHGTKANLKSMPDLFPVLAILCALGEGSSELSGAPHLVYKESNRLAHLVDWIRQLGREVEVREDGVKISGSPLTSDQLKKLSPRVWDCDHDHRLAFAAAVAQHAGVPLEITGRQVVSKSFPDFWKILGWEA